MTLKMPAYAIRELMEKNSRGHWKTASEPLTLSLSLKKFNLFSDFEVFNSKMFDPGFHFTPSIIYWDYGRNTPDVVNIAENRETMVFGKNDSRTLLKPWTILETKEISGALNLLVFLHTSGKRTVSLPRQMKIIKQLLDKSHLRLSIKQLLSSREESKSSAIDQSLDHLLQAVKKASGEWSAPICFLNRITLSMEDLKSGKAIHIKKAPFFEMEFESRLIKS